MASIIKLCSGDGDIIETSMKTIKCSATLREALKCIDGNDVVIPLPGITTRTLRKVLRWAEYHKYDEDEPYSGYDSGNMVNYIEICDWDEKFFKVSVAEMHYIINAADFLQMRTLVDLACQNMANRLAHCTTHEMRNILLVNTDMLDAEQDNQSQLLANNLHINLAAIKRSLNCYDDSDAELTESSESSEFVSAEYEHADNDSLTASDTDESAANAHEENSNNNANNKEHNNSGNGNAAAAAAAVTDTDSDIATDDSDAEQSAFSTLSTRSSPTSTNTNSSDSLWPISSRWPSDVASESDSEDI